MQKNSQGGVFYLFRFRNVKLIVVPGYQFSCRFDFTSIKVHGFSTQIDPDQTSQNTMTDQGLHCNSSSSFWHISRW